MKNLRLSPSHAWSTFFPFSPASGKILHDRQISGKMGRNGLSVHQNSCIFAASKKTKREEKWKSTNNLNLWDHDKRQFIQRRLRSYRNPFLDCVDSQLTDSCPFRVRQFRCVFPRTANQLLPLCVDGLAVDAWSSGLCRAHRLLLPLHHQTYTSILWINKKITDSQHINN